MTYFTIQPLETSLFLFSVLFLPCECKHEASEEREPATTGAYQEPAEQALFLVRLFRQAFLALLARAPPPPKKTKNKKTTLFCRQLQVPLVGNRSILM